MGASSEVDIPPMAFPGVPLRLEELRYIVACIRQGECCSVVGPSNTGKSWLLRSLRNEDVRVQCTSKERVPRVPVFVDCLEASNDEQSFYELLLRRGVHALESPDSPCASVDDLRDLHDKLAFATTRVAIRSAFARGIRRLAKRGVVLILDEFDDSFRLLPPWPFRHLRAVYDAQRSQFTIITGTSRSLEYLRSDADTYEFRELFHLNTLMLGPLCDQDAERFVRHLAHEDGGPQDDNLVAQVIEFAGGHLGLLERVYSVLASNGFGLFAPASSDPGGLLQQPAIQQECQRLWDELESEDQQSLLTLAAGKRQALDALQKQQLETKGLVRVGAGGDLVLSSPVFDAFVTLKIEHGQDKQTKGVHCDLQTGRVWVDGRELTSELTDLQHRLIVLLYEKDGGVLTYEEIADKVYDAEEGVAPGAIYELVSRLRENVESDLKKPQYVITVRGIGYQLKTP